MTETFADYFTIPEVMELFGVVSRYAIYTKGGIEEQYGIEPLKFAPKLRLYRVVDVVDHVTDKNALEMILEVVQAQRGELVLGDWLPVRRALGILKVSRQWLNQLRNREDGIRTITIDNSTLYFRGDVERFAEQSRQDKTLPV